MIIFNKPQGVMQLHDRKGKHGAAVTCGDWLSDNRLGLASGTRVKISKPLAEEAAQWESYSKFKLSGMLSRVPRKFKDAGAPKLMSFSLSYPPFVAVCIGENYMLVFGTTGASNNEDVRRSAHRHHALLQLTHGRSPRRAAARAHAHRLLASARASPPSAPRVRAALPGGPHLPRRLRADHRLPVARG